MAGSMSRSQVDHRTLTSEEPAESAAAISRDRCTRLKYAPPGRNPGRTPGFSRDFNENQRSGSFPGMLYLASFL